MRARYGVNPSQAVKNYYDFLLYTCGRDAKDIAVEIGMSAVSLCNLAPRLEQMTVENLAKFAKAVGKQPGEMVDIILKLRKNPKHDIYFKALPKNIRVERVEKTTRKQSSDWLRPNRERKEQGNSNNRGKVGRPRKTPKDSIDNNREQKDI